VHIVPQFTLTLKDGDGIARESMKIHADEIASAVRLAERAARTKLVHRLMNDEEPGGDLFEVEDEDGRVVARLPFKDMISDDLRETFRD